MLIDKDAFSSGQIGSKLWLAKELETVIKTEGNPTLNILCLGGWYSVTNFILQTRGNLKIEKFRSIDIDPSVETIADMINNLWEWQDWRFKSITADANDFYYSLEDFNLVINTSVEHIDSLRWFENIPKGCYVVLQSNNMEHEDHSNNHKSLDDMVDEFHLNQLLYKGELLFTYPNWQFTRFMLIGKK